MRHAIACNLISSTFLFFIFRLFFSSLLAFICKAKRQFRSNTRALWDTRCLFLAGDLRAAAWQTVICVFVLVTPEIRRVCLSFRDNVAGWQRSSKSNNYGSVLGEHGRRRRRSRRRRPAMCVFWVVFFCVVRPCNHQPGGRPSATWECRVESGSRVFSPRPWRRRVK